MKTIAAEVHFSWASWRFDSRRGRESVAAAALHGARTTTAARRLADVGAVLAFTLLAACSSIVDKPVRPTLYDFGALPATAPAAVATASAPRAPVVLADLDAAGSLDGTAVLYRLAYADANELKPYALARWTASPPQLIRQRLRERLGESGRVVLNPGESASLVRDADAARQPRVLRIELEEFSQLFDSPAQSVGSVRLRATVYASTAAGERLVAQRVFARREPAATADAPGGVRALATAIDGIAKDLDAWLAQPPA